MISAMNTELIKVDPMHPDPELIRRAAEVLLRGGLVAFPTETVYGLGALALDAGATRRIFEAKGRPAHNPVIAHVANTEQARRLTAVWPEVAELLARHFWPGPLTLVLPKTAGVPDVVTAGGTTVAVRVPDHPVARALIEAAGQPVAAPSANRSMGVSPTRADHVLKTLNGRVDMVLDGGACSGGIESTVVALCEDGAIRVLRPGLISREDLERVLQIPVFEDGAARSQADQCETNTFNFPVPLPSPGMLERHYAPAAPLMIARGDGRAEVEALSRTGVRVGWLALRDRSVGGTPDLVLVREMPCDAAAYAEQLYAALHDLDAASVEQIVVGRLPEGGEWAAVRDRLQRAAVPE